MTDRPRSLRAGLAGVLLAAGLSGCGGSQDTYCSTLKDDQQQLKTLTERSSAKGEAGSRALSGTASLLSDLRDEAPDDIRGDWDTLVQAVDGLVDAVRASGASPGDFSGADSGGTPPAGVTTGQLQAVQQAAAELQATPVQQASASIEQHAQDVCQVDLGSELGAGS